MKVLWIAPYLDGTGYSEAAKNYILALDNVGVDVVCRPIKLNNFKGSVDKRIQQLMQKPLEGCTHVIQHFLPHMFSYNGNLINIGLFATETSHFPDSIWAERANMMDGIIAINQQSKESMRKSGVKTRIDIINHAADINKFQQNYAPLEQLKQYKNDGDFLFYYIGEINKRKNLAALLKAFHSEFKNSEAVQLIIKTNMESDKVRNYCDEVRRGMKITSYKEEIIITDRLSENALMKLHSTCDCLVAPSYGEAWHQPAFDSMAMGKTPIVNSCTGFLDYMSNEVGWIVKNTLEPAFGAVESLNDLYTYNENWWAIDVIDLKRCMRESFSEEKIRQEKALKGIQRSYDFSYEKIGADMKGVLESYGQNI